ncbi:calcium/sodium antiporter [Sphingosinithalassobacter sp. CS137]|uniref:calcium/sodium antiporter n=1 Tax=Sphingosinithalassobacter sp. CS137 TaxID=2762748 RepID=UPI00165E5FE4|nr:calcium/sodium antiporter [Sphingosinithalassobacter sp. CS137]
MILFASIVGGLLLLVAGGEALVRGAVRLAALARLSPLVVGLVVVGFGTSTPELVTSIEAALLGSPGIAWGNVVGSNLANTLLILGLAAVLAPFAVTRASLGRDGIMALAATALLFILALQGPVGTLAGVALLGLLAGYLVLAYRNERAAAAPVTGAAEADAPAARRGGAGAALLVLGGLALLVLGGNLLVGGAIELAERLGMSEALIGLTIVAVGTSLPELVTSVIAALRRHGEVAFGNVVGSNIYNLLGIGGMTALVAPGALPPELLTRDLPILLGTALLMLLLGLRLRYGRAAGGLLLAGYAGYLGYVVATAAGTSG